MWVPGHVGIRGNETADRPSKEALEKEPTDDLMPFSDLKPLTAKHVHQVWQKEWDETAILSNKLHDISPELSDKLIFCKIRKEDTILNRLHICHSYLTHAFVLKKKKKSLLFALHVMLLTQSNISLLSVLTEYRLERNFSVRDLCIHCFEM